ELLDRGPLRQRWCGQHGAQQGGAEVFEHESPLQVVLSEFIRAQLDLSPRPRWQKIRYWRDTTTWMASSLLPESWITCRPGFSGKDTILRKSGHSAPCAWPMEATAEPSWTMSSQAPADSAT